MGIGVEVVINQEKDVYIATIKGRIDASSTPLVEKKLAPIVEKANKFLIDFSSVTYLSSAGMRLLLSMTKKMTSKEKLIAFFGMSDDVFEIIKMAGFERILRIFNTKDEALKSLQ